MKRFVAFLAVIHSAALGCGGAGDGGSAGHGSSAGKAGSGGSAGLAGGTGASGGSAGGSVAPVPLGEFATGYVSAVCDNVARCCARGGFRFDATSCQETMETYASALAAGAMADPPRSDYDTVAAGACFSLVASAWQACVLEAFPEPNPCDRMFTGRLAQGEPCNATTECTAVEGSIVECASTSGAAPTCSVRSGPKYRAGVGGEACSVTCSEDEDQIRCEDTVNPAAPDTACYVSDGLYCASGDTCSPLPSSGVPCGSGEYCADGAFCESGTCAPKRETGACDTSEACTSAAYCNTATQQCMSKATDGAPCANGEECLNDGCYGGACGPQLLASEENCFSN